MQSYHVAPDSSDERAYSTYSATEKRLQRLLLSVKIPGLAIYILSKVRSTKPFSTTFSNQVHYLRFLLAAICFAHYILLASRSWLVCIAVHLLSKLAHRISLSFLPLLTAA